jgi:hypothetical protein
VAPTRPTDARRRHGLGAFFKDLIAGAADAVPGRNVGMDQYEMPIALFRVHHPASLPDFDNTGVVANGRGSNFCFPNVAIL